MCLKLNLIVLRTQAEYLHLYLHTHTWLKNQLKTNTIKTCTSDQNLNNFKKCFLALRKTVKI